MGIKMIGATDYIPWTQTDPFEKHISVQFCRKPSQTEFLRLQCFMRGLPRLQVQETLRNLILRCVPPLIPSRRKILVEGQR